MWGCAWYRCHVPAMELTRRGHEALLRQRLDPALLGECDVVVFEHPFDPDVIGAIEWARGSGKLTVVDLDDDYWSIHPSNPAYGTWHGTGRLEILAECMRGADLVTVSTQELVPLNRPMNRNIEVLPNMLPAEHWPAQRVRHGGRERLTVGWAGSPSHAPDLPVLSGAVETLLGAYPNIEFVFAGMRDVPFKPHERIRLLDHVMIEQYPTILEQFDIGVIPLLDGRFNRCKSDLKYLEYSMMGIPSVASKLAPYERSIEHGVSGLLARNPKDWLKHLRRLIEDAELRDEMGGRARAFAETRTIERNIGSFERAYRIDR